MSAAVFGAAGGVGRALVQELQRRGVKNLYAISRGAGYTLPGTTALTADPWKVADMRDVTDAMRSDPPRIVIVATGILTHPDGTGPERSLRQIDGPSMLETFRINTVVPALIAKYVIPLMPREGRSVFAVLSARVGSIADNQLGGWHSYRASKAALNMLVKSVSIEMGRTHKTGIAVALHPGTVDTQLSKPFQANLPDGQLTDPKDAAANLLRVIEGLEAKDSGGFFDYAGDPVPY